MTLVLWTETTNASARSYERRHLSRSTSRKSVAGSVSSYRTSRREIASPTTGDQQGGCKTLEKLQTTGRGRRWGSPGQPPAAAAAEASSAPAGRRGAPAGAAAAVGGELEEGGARATSGWNLSRDSRKSATAQAAPPLPRQRAAGKMYRCPSGRRCHCRACCGGSWRASSERPRSQTRRCPWGRHCRLQGRARRSGWRRGRSVSPPGARR